MKVRDVFGAVEELAPAGWAYSWDHSGLAIGSPDALPQIRAHTTDVVRVIR